MKNEMVQPWSGQATLGILDVIPNSNLQQKCRDQRSESLSMIRAFRADPPETPSPQQGDFLQCRHATTRTLDIIDTAGGRQAIARVAVPVEEMHSCREKFLI